MDKKYLLMIAGAMSLGAAQNAMAQGASFSNMRVHAGTEMHVMYPGNLSFGNNVATERASGTSLVSFASLAAANSASGFINGRVKVNGNSGAVFIPVGQNNASAVALSSVSNPAQPITALYASTPAPNRTIHDSQLFAVSAAENWTISGNNSARLKLAWGAWSGNEEAALAYGIGIGEIAIAAWDGAKWAYIPSAADNGSTLVSGSITSTSTINFNSYTQFAIAFKNTCAPLVASTGTAIWNGSWNATPDQYTNAIISVPMTVTPQTSFTANSLVLNADITLQDGAYIEVIQAVQGTGKLILSSQASFVQRSPLGDGPKIELTKQTRALRKWDFAYWGTPIKENFAAQIANAKVPNYTAAAFDQKLKYVSEAGTGGSWQNLDAIVPGKGFTTRIKDQAPFTNTANRAVVNFPIIGTANNGNVAVTLGSATTGARSFNLLANPYPSAIDAAVLLRNNPNLGGAIYLWTAKEFNSAGAAADYAIWTMAGSVVTSPIAQLPTQYIASGQGFMVKGLAAGGVATFTNCMRVAGNNQNFFRDQEQPMDRYWLNLTNSAGIFSQILVNYTEEATYGDDRLYDAPRNSMSTAQLYSYIGTSKFAVNSRPEFEVADIVPLGVSRTDADAQEFTIALHQPEGLFATGEVAIYLHDKQLGTYHSLKQGSYTFAASELQNNDRFEIVYQSDALGVDNPAVVNAAYMIIKDAQFRLNASQTASSVMIYDLTGRLVAQYQVGEKQFSAPFNHAHGVYIAKAKMEDGTIATQKLIHGK